MGNDKITHHVQAASERISEPQGPHASYPSGEMPAWFLPLFDEK